MVGRSFLFIMASGREAHPMFGLAFYRPKACFIVFILSEIAANRKFLVDKYTMICYHR